MILLDGMALAQKLHLERMALKGDLYVGLDVILVGDDPASKVYVERKRKACERNEIRSHIHHLSSKTSQEELEDLIQSLNLNQNVTGILLQLPLPDHLDKHRAVRAIHPSKDVDGLHPENLGCLTQGYGNLWPCTPLGCIRLLDSINYELRGKHAVVIGSSFLVGKPLATMLTLRDATVTLCHRYTENLEPHVRGADVLAVAVGKENLIPGHWVKEGAVVLDVGITRRSDGSLVGDVEFSVAKERAYAITPVPGGIGPMTVAMLMENAFRAAHPNIISPALPGRIQEDEHGRDRVRTLSGEETGETVTGSPKDDPTGL